MRNTEKSYGRFGSPAPGARHQRRPVGRRRAVGRSRPAVAWLPPTTELALGSRHRRSWPVGVAAADLLCGAAGDSFGRILSCRADGEEETLVVFVKFCKIGHGYFRRGLPLPLRTKPPCRLTRRRAARSSRSVRESAALWSPSLGSPGWLPPRVGPAACSPPARSPLKLSVGRRISRAFAPEEKAGLLAAGATRRSPSIYPALMLALHAGMRDAEIRELRWAQIDLRKGIVTVGESKTEAGEGRTIPLNADIRVRS